MDDYSNKPSWPYVFGTFGASMFALGMLLVLAVFASSSGSPDLGRVGFMLAGAGSVLLGITWTQLLRVNQAGIGQIAACFLLPVAMIFLATRSGYDDLQTAVLILCLSLCAFALAHVFIPRLDHLLTNRRGLSYVERLRLPGATHCRLLRLLIARHRHLTALGFEIRAFQGAECVTIVIVPIRKPLIELLAVGLLVVSAGFGGNAGQSLPA
jgi:hypothetical protein